MGRGLTARLLTYLQLQQYLQIHRWMGINSLTKINQENVQFSNCEYSLTLTVSENVWIVKCGFASEPCATRLRSQWLMSNLQNTGKCLPSNKYRTGNAKFNMAALLTILLELEKLIWAIHKPLNSNYHDWMNKSSIYFFDTMPLLMLTNT